MKSIQKTLKSADTNHSQTGKKRSRTFAGAALLTAGLLTAGCGDTINNYYGEGPPSQENPSADETCAMTPVTELTCSTGKVTTVLRDGESILLDGYSIFVEPGTDSSSRTVYVLDDECNAANQVEVQIGETQSLGALFGGNEQLTVTLNPGDSNSVEVELSLPLLSGGVLNMGEQLLFQVDNGPLNLSVRLDDLSTVPSDEPPSALVSLLTDAIVLMKMKIQEGKTETVALGDNIVTIRAETVSPGYTFGASWADIRVYSCGQGF